MSDIATNTIGLDLGDKRSQICVLDASGLVVEESRVRTTPESLSMSFGARAPARIVLEVGTHSRWVSALLEDAGHEVIVANARRVRLIAENDRKSDAVDAELLARLGRVDPKLLVPIKHRAAEAHKDLVVIRARAAAVRARTQLVNAVRGLLKPHGVRMPSCSTARFSKLLSAIPEELQPALQGLMVSIEALTKQIHAYDAQVKSLAEARADVVPLLQVPGVGPTVALTFAATLEAPERYRSARSVGSYLGLTPRRSQSGDSDPAMRISKAGDRYLRTLLVQSAQYILSCRGPDSELKQWGLRLAERGGKTGKKRAVVALARKLTIVLYRLWTTGERYRAFPNTPEASAQAA